jgi:hypothetical protein
MRVTRADCRLRRGAQNEEAEDQRRGGRPAAQARRHQPEEATEPQAREGVEGEEQKGREEERPAQVAGARLFEAAEPGAGERLEVEGLQPVLHRQCVDGEAAIGRAVIARRVFRRRALGPGRRHGAGGGRRSLQGTEPV